MVRVVPLIFVGLLNYSLYAQSPGGVSSNLRWWLKANAGTFTDNGTTVAADGQNVQQWNDQSAVANHAQQATLANKPVYKTGIINGNPVLRFAADQFIDGIAAPGVGPAESMYMFLVFKQNSYVAGGTTDGNGTFIIDRTTATNNLASFKIVNTDKYFYQKRNDAGGSLTGPVSVSSAPTGIFSIVDYYRDIGNSYGIFINGKLDATSGGDSEALTAPVLRIGRHATTTNGGLNGDLAEVILYNANLPAANRARVESYLAIKYGVTLDQTTATNYVNSSGTVVYPATTTHDSYDNNIAGIARDNASGLNQTASQSQNAQSIVKLFNPSSLDDGDFLIWGNDSPTIWNSSDVPSPFINRLSRIWRVAETGETGTFSISFDLSGLGADMTDATKFALLIDDNGVFDDATAYTTGRSIVGNVVTFTGAGINNNQYFSLASSLIPGPGGVAATTVWLRADEEVYTNAGTTLATNGQTVQQWNTKSGITAANAIQTTAGSKPTYVTNVANSNPVVRFATSKFLDFGTLGVSSTSDLVMTMVFQPTTTAGGTMTNTSGSYLLDRTTNTTPVVALKLLSTSKIGFQERTDAGSFDGPVTTSNVTTASPQIIDFYRDYAVRFGIYYNGAQENTLTEAGGALTYPIPRIGADQSGSSGLNGDIAEFIFYTRDITNAERNRIDSYLAIKYGVTLNQVTLTNYTASDGVVIYPATSSHSGYVSDIAGIGKDNVSRLNQSNSKSANANSVVRVQSPGSLDDLDFFIWGDNAGSLTSPSSSVDGTTIKRRLSRVWKIAERGDVGTITISFDLTNVPGSKSQSDLRLLIDRNANGFADNDVTPVSGTLVGQIFSVTGINLQNNDFITIGTTNTTSTPLPIQLVSFNARLQNGEVRTDWKTASEINNDYFTLERSVDGELFEKLLTVKGAGTSGEPHYYEATDTYPIAGVSYYRLKQTDFDGKTSYSEVRKIDVPLTSLAPRIYPNPAERGQFTIELPVESSEAFFQVLNTAGQVVYTGESTSAIRKWDADASQLPAGIYYVRVSWELGSAALKLIIK